MSKLKIIIGLATLVCAIAAMSTPAGAFFEATVSGATKGPIDKLPSEARLTVKSGGIEIGSVICVKTTSATGFWNIQNSEEQVITKGTKQQQQPGTKVGPHEAITITDWGTCTGFGLPAKVSPCRLQVAQPGKNVNENQQGLGSVQTDCVISIPTGVCTITIEQRAANHNLVTILLSPSAQGFVLIKANVTGITYKAAGAGCATIGIPAEGNEGEFKTDNGEEKGIQTSLQKLI